MHDEALCVAVRLLCGIPVVAWYQARYARGTLHAGAAGRSDTGSAAAAAADKRCQALATLGRPLRRLGSSVPVGSWPGSDIPAVHKAPLRLAEAETQATVPGSRESGCHCHHASATGSTVREGPIH